MTKPFDALVVGDARFAGGSSAALAADVAAMATHGLRIGLIFVRSHYLDDSRDRPNPSVLALADLDGVTLLPADAPARAELAFLHHPLVFYRGIEEQLRLSANRSVLVIHHAPFRADGSLEWDPVATRWRTLRQTGLGVWFAPISGLVREQLARFAPLVRQTSGDWPNTFDPADWSITRAIGFDRVLTIGRHGRADPLKFPATGAEIDASLPVSDSVRVRVLGCPAEALSAKGAHPDRWDVRRFGSEPVIEFLNSLDVFTYHYHPNWLESFGRTVAEAALTGRVCLVDPRLQATFGNMAQYCAAADVADALNRLRADPISARSLAERGRATALRRYSSESMGARIAALRRDRGSTSRLGVTAPPLHVASKLAGHYRRRARGIYG